MVTAIRTLAAAAILAITAVVVTAQGAAKLEVDLAPEASIKERLEKGRTGSKQREAAIRDLFTEAGCSTRDQRVDRNAANVICTLPGQTDSTIVIGGHFDFVERGQGIVDDWSGVSLLPSVYQALKSRPRRHTFVFAAFAAEERGLFGSARYVKELTSEQKELTRAFINLECLGLSPVKVWTHRATPSLLGRLREVELAIGVTPQGVDVDQIGDDDTHSFLKAHIPVLTLHSLTQETLRVLHSERDRQDAIRFDDYYQAYKLATFYLAYLDVNIE